MYILSSCLQSSLSFFLSRLIVNSVIRCHQFVNFGGFAQRENKKLPRRNKGLSGSKLPGLDFGTIQQLWQWHRYQHRHRHQGHGVSSGHAPHRPQPLHGRSRFQCVANAKAENCIQQPIHPCLIQWRHQHGGYPSLYPTLASSAKFQEALAIGCRFHADT